MKEFRYVLQTSGLNALPGGYLRERGDGRGLTYTDDIFKAKFIDTDNEDDLELAYQAINNKYYNLVQVCISVEVVTQKTLKKHSTYTVEDYK